ncbi:hypothetical protein CEN50_24210 [Fischerella thermalis CCMEE 5268]|uniref:Uncharacterized protein n=1 Tax=Fischerella thermalis CCMEE 5268 TaxID=2019662 RepID=A0A2N6K9N9_9CYAN|nr:hypothetical protein [Fischerella thermalis]PLZ94808.1 hypothetical protein CEN50_24210 [Fischerella thermalis CCMEE 5268]
MKLKRRQFLFLSGLGAISAGFLASISRGIIGQNSEQISKVIAANPSTKKDLLETIYKVNL